MGAALAPLAVRPASADAPDGDARIRVLVVDDSAVVRSILTRMLERSGRFTVVAAAATAAAADDLLLRHRVDVILLDVEMPGTDGLTALPRLIAGSRGARVVIVSSFCADGAVATLRALALGAADTLLKPGAVSLGEPFADMLVARLERLGRAPAEPPQPAPQRAEADPHQRPPARRGPVDCIAIGASTGGIHALAAFLGALPRTVTTPILVTQHLPPPFMPYFAAQLAEASGREAAVAEDGMPMLPDTIRVAPGDGHLALARRGGEVRAVIDRTPVANGNVPSVDPMFRAVAAVYGVSAVGVLLTGMGRDGAEGAADLVAAGGDLLAQDRDSSVVWGMPGTVVKAGLATEIAPPAALAAFLARRILGRTAAWN